MHLGHHLGDLDHPGDQVQALAAQPGHLPDAKPAIGTKQDQRPVGRPDRHGQAAHLGHSQEPHLGPLDLGQRDLAAWRAGDHAALDSGRQDLGQHLVALVDRRRRQALGRQFRDPGPHIALADAGQLERAEAGQQVAVQQHPIPHRRGRPDVVGRLLPLPHPGREPNPTQGWVRPVAPGLVVLDLSQPALRLGLAFEAARVLAAVRPPIACPPGLGPIWSPVDGHQPTSGYWLASTRWAATYSARSSGWNRT
jgi:hypothetical protein